MATDDEFLTEGETADQLRVNPRTLQRLRQVGGGPPFVKIGPRRIVYRRSDLDEWLRSRTFAHAAEAAVKILIIVAMVALVPIAAQAHCAGTAHDPLSPFNPH